MELWHHLTLDATALALDTDAKLGLSTREAARRLLQFGRNVFETKRGTGRFRIIANQLTSPLILILIAAGGVMLAVSHYRDAIFIFVAVLVNTTLGFWQEYKAERALSKLKAYLRQRARVIRDGKEREIDAEEIVRGDVIRLAQGDRVPADARIIFANDFQIDESILTGESLPVAKSADAVAESLTIVDQTSMVFAGTLVIQGVGSALVCRTDAETELGKIAALLSKTADERTPLQKAIAKLSIILSAVLGFLTLTVFIVGILAGRPTLDMFLMAVAIAVSAIPEGLPISLTVILAIGVERMAKRKGVVRKLVAAEALGSTTIILTDKTGTLTMAQMALREIIPFDISEQEVLSRALTNANVLIENPEDEPDIWRMSGKIMETALVRSAALRGIPFEKITDKSHVVQSMPFNAIQKFSASLIHQAGKHIVILFGAPDILIRHANLDEPRKHALLHQVDQLASSGERVLGVATKEILNADDFSFTKNFKPTHLSFDGLITFRDPVRAGVFNAIQRVGRAGVKTVIVTGDHRGTAVAVAREIGIGAERSSVLDAAELSELSDAELRERLPHLSIFSRVTPADKLRIAQQYQSRGEIVAMTGDGVNDAPSIKQASVGIAMGSGTAVAQDVADLILLDDNFETIVAAIEEGRRVLSNIRKVLVYLLSAITDELILIGGAIMLGIPLPLSALQILWVNFFSDSFPAIAFAFERDEDGLVRTPNRLGTGLFDPLMRFLVLGIGILTSAFLFVLYLLLLKFGFDAALVNTFIFAAFGTYTLFLAFSVRNLERSIWSYPLFSNHYLTGGLGIGFVLMAAAVYLPVLQSLFGTIALPLPWVIGVFLVGILNIALIEAAKRFFKNRSAVLKLAQ